MRSKLASTCTNFALLASSIALFLGAAELAIRYLDPKPEISKQLIPTADSIPPEERILFHNYHPLIGYDGKPNVEKEFWFHMVHQNSRGERGIEYSYERDNSELRVLLLGDSGTWGYPLADEDTLWKNLDSELRTNAATNPQVINLGTIGYSADQELLSYFLKGTLYHPDVVVINFFAENDLWEMMTDSAWGVFRPRMIVEGDNLCLTDIPVTKASGWPDTNLGEMFGFDKHSSSLLEKSQLISFLKSRELKANVKSLFSSSEIKTPLEKTEMVRYLKNYLPCLRFEELPTPTYFDYPKRDEEAINLYLKIISVLKEKVQQENARLFVTLIPSTESYSGKNENYLRVKSGLEKLGISPIDLDEMAHKAGLTDKELFTIGHQNGVGNRLLAKELKNRIGN